jgi:multidrug resistance protein, MATE family
MAHPSSSLQNQQNQTKPQIQSQDMYFIVPSKPYANNSPIKQQLFNVSDLSREAISVFGLSFPIALTALLFYSRSAISMLFLGSLGDLALAAGSLAIAFANITGYSVLSGLSLGMEPLCSQSFGANNPKLLSLTLHRSVLFLLCSSLPITVLWLNMCPILIFFGQDPEITRLAQKYLLFSLPDLFSFSLIHPIRIYLRSQGITFPLTLAAAFAVIFHLLANFLLVNHFGLGPTGVAAAASASNLLLLLLLLLYVRDDPAICLGPTKESLIEWAPLARLAFPSCVSVCLEWWWYELIILMCGLLPDPKSAVASMGVLIQTTSLLYVFPSSLGFGVSARVGNELGANRPFHARAAAVVSISISVIMGLCAMGFAFSMRNIWAGFFTNDSQIQRLTAAALPIIGLCELGNCPQTVGCGVLRGSARPVHAAHVNLGAFYIVGFPVAIVLAFELNFGFCGLWMGLLAAQACCAGLMLYVVGSTDWIAQAHRAQLLASLGSVIKDIEEGQVGNEIDTNDDTRCEKRDECYEPLIDISATDIGR